MTPNGVDFWFFFLFSREYCTQSTVLVLALCFDSESDVK